jgi:uncharacterized protein (TIGR02588 family)
MKPKKNALEWTVFAASLVVIGVTLALLLTGGTGPRDAPADLRATTGAPVRSSNGFAVPVTIANEGPSTAEEAHVEVALTSGGKELEKAELTIAFVPRGSQREGWVVFHTDPRCCTVSARVVSFEKP